MAASSKMRVELSVSSSAFLEEFIIFAKSELPLNILSAAREPTCWSGATLAECGA
eukprot:CAMPEP_0195092706 /NCGR_PEP_ID=MMETSP0448-20130528/38073_1 /TAXON_ID=66468 /ORGANISM="Heterocapsa triquestra, Strain CCMP 448" /LENGTH=54 /DNA_ID=CAMNT_0040126585 /DNA_START=40 /DNA_END=200 /DNA_ORIENTATION=-